MLVRITINTDNAAFHSDDCDCDNPNPARVTCDSAENHELGFILSGLSIHFSTGQPPNTVLDSNGNTVGTIEYI